MTINEQNQSLQCPVCKDPMAFQIAKGRKSGKPFLMVKCLRDGRDYLIWYWSANWIVWLGIFAC